MSKVGDGSIEGRFIMGLTGKAIEKLSDLTRLWLKPLEIKTVDTGFDNEGWVTVRSGLYLCLRWRILTRLSG